MGYQDWEAYAEEKKADSCLLLGFNSPEVGLVDL